MAQKSTTSGKFHVMLPEKTSFEAQGQRETSTCTWPAALEGGLVGITKAQLSSNLVWTGAIDPRGVSHPWAAAWAFEYKLVAGDDVAAESLRLILMARFANAIKESTRTIRRDGSILERVLLASLPDADGRNERTFRTLEWSTTAKRLSPVVAGSMPPRWYLYPSTTYQSVEGINEIRSVLLGGKKAGLLLDFIEESGSRKIQIADPELRQRFHQILLGLGEDGSRATGAWKDWLVKAARGGLPAGVVGSYPGDIEGVFPTCYHGAAWQCPKHSADAPWGQDGSIAVCVLDSAHTNVLCTTHDSPVVVEGRPVSAEALGATVLRRPDGIDELLLWTDAKRDDNISVASETAASYVLQFGQGPRIEIRGRKVSLRDVECQWNVVPPIMTANAADRTIPIRAEYLDLIEEPPVWVGSLRKWQVKLRGRPTLELLPSGGDDSTAVADPGNQSGVIVWPPEALDGWGFDVVGAHLQYGADEVALACRAADGRLCTTPFKSNLLIETTPRGSAEYVVIRRNGKEGGAIRIGRKSVSRPTDMERGLIAIDFGTSNTTVRFKIKGRNESGAPERDFRVFNGSEKSASVGGCHLDAAHVNFQTTLIGAQRIFSEWYVTRRPIPLLSTLLWTLSDSSRKRVMSSIVPREPGVMYALSLSSLHADHKIHADLKWHGLGNYDQEALNDYLMRAMAPAFYALAKRGVDRVTVAASYPLAFDPARKNDFKVAVKRAVEGMAVAAGMKAGANEVDLRFYSESLAGTRDIAAENARYKITIDLGGGTTDLAILGPPANDPNGPLECRAAESLEIGARKIIAALCGDIPEEDLQRRIYKALMDADRELPKTAASDAKLSSESIALAFESLLQDAYVDGLYANLDNCIGATARASVAALLAGIAVVADRMLKIVLASTPGVTPKVQVVFLGQGWHLLRSGFLKDHLSESKFISSMTKLGRDRYELLPASSSGGDDLALRRKLQVVNGVMQLLELNQDSDDNQTITFVAMDLKLIDGTSLSQGHRVRDVEVTGFAEGDPGFDVLIGELAKVAEDLNGTESNVISQWLDVEHVNSPTRRQQLVRDGCRVLNHLVSRHELSANKQGLISSPLSKFVSGPWASTWIRTRSGS